jgi:hypothetical protein
MKVDDDAFARRIGDIPKVPNDLDPAVGVITAFAIGVFVLWSVTVAWWLLG